MKKEDLTDPEVLAFLEIHCTKATASRVELFRGGSIKGTSFIGNIRQDRTPLNSDAFDVQIFNTLMEANGWPHRKSNTLSTSVSLEDAYAYSLGKNEGNNGATYRIFPDNGCVFVGSTRYDDFIHIPHTINRVIEGEAYRGDVIEYVRNNYQTLTQACGLFGSASLDDMTHAEGEVLVHGSKFVGVREI